MAIPRSTHDYDIDPAYFALRAPKGGGSSDLEQRVEHLEECCAEVQPALEDDSVSEQNIDLVYSGSSLEPIFPHSDPVEVGTIWPAHYSGDYFDRIYAKKINNVRQQFICGATVSYDAPDYIPTGTVITSIDQDYVQVRTGKNWAKTSNRISTYTGSEFN